MRDGRLFRHRLTTRSYLCASFTGQSNYAIVSTSIGSTTRRAVPSWRCTLPAIASLFNVQLHKNKRNGFRRCFDYNTAAATCPQTIGRRLISVRNHFCPNVKFIIYIFFFYSSRKKKKNPELKNLSRFDRSHLGGLREAEKSWGIAKSPGRPAGVFDGENVKPNSLGETSHDEQQLDRPRANW